LEIAYGQVDTNFALLPACKKRTTAVRATIKVDSR